MLEHVGKRLPQQFEGLFTEACLVGEVGGYETVGDVEAVGDGEFAAHRAVVTVLFFGFSFGGDSHADDGVFLRHNGIDRSGES